MLAAWEWLKKYWAPVAGVLVAILGFLAGVSVKKAPVIVQGQDPEKKKIEDETQKAIADAQKTHDTTVADAEAADQKAQDAVVAGEQKEVVDVESDVNKTNDYLKDVSKQIGGK